MFNKIKNGLQKVREKKPLVLNITNYVSMDFVANALLALGAVPIMSVFDEELEELIQISGAININLGTLDKSFIERCLKVAKIAEKHDKTIILDPVGSGATHIRTQTALKILEYADIIRGNASEIISLKGTENRTLGVESTHSTDKAKDIADYLAHTYQSIIVVSGPIDFITDGTEHKEVVFGSQLMPLVTGMGCALSAVIAAFSTINKDHFESSCLATTYFGLCGTVAESKTQNPGTFRTTFIDVLHEADFT